MLLSDRINKNLAESNLELVWIEKEDLIDGIKLNLFEICSINLDQGDETFKHVVIFNGRKLVYVGERL